MEQQALSNVKVLDLTHYISGPYCTKFLADYGADVIKIEPPWGEKGRKLAPFAHDEVHYEKSGFFLHLNTNKKGITLNLKKETGRRMFMQLLKDVDILVENFAPRVMSSLGLSYETLEKVNPKLVMCSISNFGQTGPYRDYKASELVLSAIGSSMTSQGFPEREPLKLSGTIMQHQSGLVAAVATLIAYYDTRTSGIGQHLDIAITETLLNSIDRRSMFLTGTAYRGDVAEGVPEVDAGFGMGAIPCQDGYVFQIGGAPYYPRIVRMVDSPELRADDPRFNTEAGQMEPENRDIFDATFLSWTMQRTKIEIAEKGQACGVLITPVNTIADIMEDPHIKERHSLIDIEHPVAGKFTYPGGSINNSWFQIRRPAPMLGEHNAEVYGKLGYSQEDLVRSRELNII